MLLSTIAEKHPNSFVHFAVMRAFTSKYVEKIYEKQEIEKEKNESLYKVS